MPRVLLVLTSAHPVLYPSGLKTGVFWSEAVDPYDVFTAAGWKVDVASETGTAAVDEHSVEPDMLVYSHSADSWNDKAHPMHALLNGGLKAGSELKASDYDAVFFSAGHGALYDYPSAKHVAGIAVQLYEAGKYVAAICHGTVVFAATLDSAGSSIAKGKRITGFTRKGESLVGLSGKIAADGVRDCEAVAADIGAVWVEPADPWADYTVQDGRILTGVNPASGTTLAKQLLEAARA